MKRILTTLFTITLGAVLIGCAVTKNGTTTSLSGNWLITADQTAGAVGDVGSSGTYQVSFVSSACNVSTPVGTVTVPGPTCFIADNDTGQGSVSAAGGSGMYPPQSVLIGTSPARSNAPVDGFLVEADQSGNAAVFFVTGTVSNGTMTGTWSCNPTTPVCSGMSGTFSGTRQ